MPYTLADLRASSIAEIAGVEPTSTLFTARVNDAISRLMLKGDWYNTLVRARFTVVERLITWPRWVGTVHKINVACSPVPIRNHWYEFSALQEGDCCQACKSSYVAMDAGLSPVFNNIACGSVNYVQCYVRNTADAGKTITFYGKDVNGWDTSETLTLVAQPVATYVRSSTAFQAITRVSKQVTLGIVDCYQYVSATDTLLDLGHYYGSETEPMYRQTRIPALSCSSSSTQVSALIKQQLVPLVLDTDVAQIDNIAAIKMMVQAIKFENANDRDNKVKWELDAIRELNAQMADRFPDDQVTADNLVFGDTVFSNQTF